MKLADRLDAATMFSGPPPGSTNVMVGDMVAGPGGRWVPCVTRAASGSYFPNVFQVGPGCRQVCASTMPLPCADTALLVAMDLARTAAE